MEDISFMVLELVLIPAIMICFGIKFMKKPPKSKTSFFAYKTDRALKSEESWAFAHRYFGRLWLRFGIATVVIIAAVMLWAYFQGEQMMQIVAGILCLAQLIPLFLPILPTELALKKCFDRYGNRIDFNDKVDKDYT